MANKIGRVPVREQDPQVRVTNFEEVCYGYSLEEDVYKRQESAMRAGSGWTTICRPPRQTFMP